MREMTDPVPVALGERFADAVAYAAKAHGAQLRKGTSIPYLSHLLSVAALVLEDGGGEDEAIGGLLHDAAEDAGGLDRLDDIRERFGEAVARIVDGCTDTYEDPKPDWRERKERYLEHLRTETDERILRVSLADKLHNARSILRDHREIGELVWRRFNRGADQQMWYYRELEGIFARKKPGPLFDEFYRTVDELERLTLR